MIDAGVGKIQDHAYFAAIDHEMDHGGREALLHHLLHFDLKNVNLRAIPETKALLEQKFASASAEEKFWLDTLKSGRLPGALEDEPSACRKKKLYDAYISHARRTGVSHRSIATKVGMFLVDYVPGLVTDQKVTITPTYGEPRQVPAYSSRRSPIAAGRSRPRSSRGSTGVPTTPTGRPTMTWRSRFDPSNRRLSDLSDLCGFSKRGRIPTNPDEIWVYPTYPTYPTYKED